jgi:predicted SAM-dependent methyltransferase
MFLSRIKNAVVGNLLRGGRYYCPICRVRFRRFLAAGDPGRLRPNARCPGCGSVERHRMLWLYLSNETDILSRPVSVLHVAPEVCLSRALGAHAGVSYTTVDSDPVRADLAMDVTKLRFPEESFDYVLCSHVLEHVENDRVAMSEFFRVTKKGGKTLVMVPTKGSSTYENFSLRRAADRFREFGQGDHVRLYGADIADRLQDAGFQVECRSYAKELGTEWTGRASLMMASSFYDTEEYIFVCKRPV